jgi:elongation factor P
MYEGKPIGIDLPASVEMEVVQTEPGVKGDRSSAGTKPATTETGLVVQVPLFVENGDRIKVDTRTGSYMTRVT